MHSLLGGSRVRISNFDLTLDLKRWILNTNSTAGRGQTFRAEGKNGLLVDMNGVLQEKAGEEELARLGKAAALDTEKLFAADPEFDPEDLPSVPEFLEAEGLKGML